MRIFLCLSLCLCAITFSYGLRRVLHRTSDVAPIVATIFAVLVLVLVAAIVVLGFIAALLLAALVLGFIAVTATAAAAVAASFPFPSFPSGHRKPMDATTSSDP